MADSTMRSRTNTKKDQVPTLLFKELSGAAEASADLHLN